MSAVDSMKVQKLSEENYIYWEPTAQALLEERECWDAIVGTVQQSVAAEIASPAEKRIDRKAWRTLVLIVEHKFLRYIPPDKSAHYAWNQLAMYFKNKYGPMQVYLDNEFNELTIRPGEKVSAFCSRLQEHVDRLALAGVEVSESRIVNRLLTGVAGQSKFSHLVDTLIGDTTLTVDGVVQRFAKVEARVEAKGKEEVAANAANSFPCHKCGQFGHFRKDCPLKGKSSDKGGGSGRGSTCDFCSLHGHDASVCRDKLAFERLVARKLIPASTQGGIEHFSNAVAYSAEIGVVEEEITGNLPGRDLPFLPQL